MRHFVSLLAKREAIAEEAVDGFTQYKNVLYVGAHPKRFQLYDRLHAANLQITVLEIWPAYVEGLKKSKFSVDEIIQGDIRTIIKNLNRVFDLIIWWHGPEHVSEIEADTLLNPNSNFHQLWSRALLLGAPLGTYKQGAYEGNPHQAHQWVTKPEWFQERGYNVTTVGTPKISRSGLIAWRVK